MQILNASKACLNLRLDNGIPVSIKTGELSTPFIGSVSVLAQLLAISKPNEVAIIIGSSYELDLLRKMNASMAYLCGSEAEARQKLMGDGTFRIPEESATDIEKVTLREKVKNLTEEIAVRDQKITELTSKLDEAPSELLLKELDSRNKSLANVESERAQLQDEKDSLEKNLENLVNENTELKAKVENAEVALKEANERLENLSAIPSDTEEHYKAIEAENTELKAANTELGQKLVDMEAKVQELEAKGASANEDDSSVIGTLRNTVADLEDEKIQLTQKVEELEKVNSDMKADADKIVAEYKSMEGKVETARETLNTIMTKFHIVYDADTNTFSQIMDAAE